MRIERDERGRTVDPAQLLRRGRLTVGLRLQEERARDKAVGRKNRKLSTEECRCLQAAVEADMAGGRAS